MPSGILVNRMDGSFSTVTTKDSNMNQAVPLPSGDLQIRMDTIGSTPPPMLLTVFGVFS